MASVKVVEMAGGAELKEGGEIRHVPMYTKEIRFWDKSVKLRELREFVTGVPDAAATSATNNVQINVDKAIMDLRALLPE